MEQLPQAQPQSLSGKNLKVCETCRTVILDSTFLMVSTITQFETAVKGKVDYHQKVAKGTRRYYHHECVAMIVHS